MASFVVICLFLSFLATSHSFPTTSEANVNGTTAITTLLPVQTTVFNISTSNHTFTNHTMSQNNGGGGTTLTISICVVIGVIVLLSIAYCIYQDYRGKKGTIYEGELCC